MRTLPTVYLISRSSSAVHKNKSPATSVTRLSYVYPSSISLPRKFAATKGFIENISYSCSTHSHGLRKP